MKILFVCKYNRFRSQIAEQFFKKYNKDKNISARSTGIFKGLYPLDKTESNSAKEFGIEIKKEPEAISIEVLRNIDVVVIVANDVPKELFLYEGRYLQEVEKWEIPDNFDGNQDRIKRIIRKIELNVKDLIKKLENKK